MNDNAPLDFKRPFLNRTAPRRGAANFYRSSGPGAAVGGVPLDSVESAVVAAVRMGYKVAAAQIERTERLARRLRQAGDQVAGEGSDRQALDATEQLVFRTMMSGLNWLEGVATDRSNPLKRLFTAEYRILGSLLGLTPSDDSRGRRSSHRSDSAADQRVPPPAAAPPVSAPVAAPVAPRVEQPAHLQPQIKHVGEDRRAVGVGRCELATTSSAPGEYAIRFYSTEPTVSTMDAKLIVTEKGGLTLALNTPRMAAAGLWKAAICDLQGMQVGYLEIVL